MKHFRRVLTYLKAQYKAVLLSVLCAVLAAFLFSLSISAMLPLMKVMIGEEGLHGWVGRKIVEHRSGIIFRPLPLRQAPASAVPLAIEAVELNSSAYDAGLEPGDTVIGAGPLSGTPEHHADRAEILQLLRQASPGDLELLALRPLDRTEPITVRLGELPWYAPLIEKALSRIPQGEGAEFKRKSIIAIIMVMLVATLARCTLRFAQEYLVRRIAFRCVLSLRLDAYRVAIRLPLGYFSEKGISDAISRFVQDSSQVHVGISTLLGKLLREPFTVICMAVFAFSINAEMTAVALLIAPVAALVIAKLGRKMKRATCRTLESWSRLLGRLQETLLGIRVVKGYHRESYEEDFLRQVNENLLKQQNRMAKIDAASGPILESLGMAAASVGMVFAAYWLTSENVHERMATSEFIVLVSLLAAMADSGRKLGNVWPRLQTANAAAQRVYELVDTPPETDAPSATDIEPLSRSLEMQHVSFTYPESPVPTLSDITLSVEAGQTIAIVGPNGSGKTTLLGMIPRFFIPDSGRILIDGHDIAQATLASLRGQIGIVTQQTVVFNDTIKANIAYGAPDATDAEIVSAAKRAYAHEFIGKTSDGYDTIVGQQGATLSGGQLQRLAIARAIVRDPAILILDEATSQIDSDSEAKIQKAVLEFSRGRTCFIIAHRLSTIVNADRIVVLDKGAIVAQGKHEQLLESCVNYRTLYEVQFAINDQLSEGPGQ